MGYVAGIGPIFERRSLMYKQIEAWVLLIQPVSYEAIHL